MEGRYEDSVYKDCLKSFTTNKWKHSVSSIVTPAALAANGYFYWGKNDEVKCVYCLWSNWNWDNVSSIEYEHYNTNMKCRFAVERFLTKTRKVRSWMKCGMCLKRNTSQLVTFVCGHCACSECAVNLTNCHICHAFVKFLHPIYLPHDMECPVCLDISSQFISLNCGHCVCRTCCTKLERCPECFYEIRSKLVIIFPEPTVVIID